MKVIFLIAFSLPFEIISQACPTSSFWNSASQTCLACDMSCYSCSGMPTNCTACTANNYHPVAILPGACNFACGSGQYNPGTGCINCQANCAFCLNNTVCLQCNSTYQWNYTGSNCINIPGSSVCPSGQYYDLSSSVCTVCSTNCTRCANSSFCTECQSPYMAVNGSCSINCPTNYYVNGTTCLTCQEGYYYNSTNCTACPYGCSACSNATNCSTCSSGFALNGTICQSSCQTGQYYNTSQQSCMPCLQNCAVCSSGQYCTTCQPGFNLGFQGSYCLSMCPTQGEYYNNVTKSCELCVNFCRTCTRANQCDFCFNNLPLITNATTTFQSCNTTCSVGTYPNGNQCQNCMAHCDYCQNPSYCYKCHGGYYWDTTDYACIDYF